MLVFVGFGLDFVCAGVFLPTRVHFTVVSLHCGDLRSGSLESKRLILRSLLQLLGSMVTIREQVHGWIFQRFKKQIKAFLNF